METAEARVKGDLDIDFVGSVLTRLLEEGGRPIILEDKAQGVEVVIPVDAAVAAHGLLPVFLFAGEALMRDVTGGGFALELERDIQALLSWRVKRIGGAAFTGVMLAVMEAIAQASTSRGIMVVELGRVFDEATARIRNRERKS
nr:hypothetical protein [Methylocella tundrae]